MKETGSGSCESLSGCCRTGDRAGFGGIPSVKARRYSSISHRQMNPGSEASAPGCSYAGMMELADMQDLGAVTSGKVS